MAEAQAKAFSHQFKFELVAPEKVEVSGLEERVLLPGEVGDFMVLPGHTAMLAGLRPGLVTIMRGNLETRYFIDGGFADIGNHHCTVLTPHITPLSALNAEKLLHELNTTQSKIEKESDEHARAHLEQHAKLLERKIEAVQKIA